MAETERDAGDAHGEALRTRLLLKIGNRDVYGLDFRWFDQSDITSQRKPADAVLVERREHGNLHGTMMRVGAAGGRLVAERPARLGASLQAGVRRGPP